MKAHVEPTNFIIRVFDDNKRFGEEYLLSLVGIKIDDETIRLSGLDKLMTPEIWRAIDRALREQGFEEIVFDRCGDKCFRKKQHKLKEKFNGTN